MKRIHYTLSALLLASSLIACHHDHTEHDHDHAGHVHDEQNESVLTEHEAHAAGDEIVLPADKAQAAGVVVEVIQPGPFHGVIHTSGKILSASCDETTVVATISGRVTHTGHVSEGLAVNNGTPLFTITSAGMQEADGDPVSRAKIAFEKAERDYQRAQLLIVDKLISERELAEIQSNYESARLTLQSVQQSRSTGGVQVKAPRKGYIKQNLVNDGDYVEAGQPLVIITQNQHLYLRAEVPERRFAELAHIQGARFRTSYSDTLYNIASLGGHVQSYGRSAEAGNAYLPIIFEFNNTGNIIQGSYAEVYLITNERSQVLSVPITALTKEQSLYYLYLQVDEEGYRKQEVTLGESDGERVEICTGLQGGERVVTRGALQIKLASASNAIPAHTHNH